MASEESNYQWVQLWGATEPGRETFSVSGKEIVFKGYDFKPAVRTPPGETENLPTSPGTQALAQQASLSGHGVLLSNRRFTEGSVCVEVSFVSIEQEGPIAEIVLYFDPMTNEQLNIGLGAHGGFAVLRRWSNQQTDDSTAQFPALYSERNRSSSHGKYCLRQAPEPRCVARYSIGFKQPFGARRSDLP